MYVWKQNRLGDQNGLRRLLGGLLRMEAERAIAYSGRLRLCERQILTSHGDPCIWIVGTVLARRHKSPPPRVQPESRQVQTNHGMSPTLPVSQPLDRQQRGNLVALAGCCASSQDAGTRPT